MLDERWWRRQVSTAISAFDARKKTPNRQCLNQAVKPCMRRQRSNSIPWIQPQSHQLLAKRNPGLNMKSKLTLQPHAVPFSVVESSRIPFTRYPGWGDSHVAFFCSLKLITSFFARWWACHCGLRTPDGGSLFPWAELIARHGHRIRLCEREREIASLSKNLFWRNGYSIQVSLCPQSRQSLCALRVNYNDKKPQYVKSSQQHTYR